MNHHSFRRVWRIPFVLAVAILTGLLSALLGVGGWHVLSWIALSIPLLILFWKIIEAFFFKPLRKTV
jgi:hypothetical protein